MADHAKGCLYLLTSPSGRRYVGITRSTAARRFRIHSTASVKTPLRSAIKSYGPRAFEIRTLLVADWDYLNWIEPRAIASFGARWPRGYNLREGGSQSSHHPESVARQAAKMRGRKHSEETRRKMSEAWVGRPTSSPERLKQMNLARVAAGYGPKVREASRARLIALWADPLKRAALSRKLSDIRRTKMSDPGERSKVAAAMKRYWSRKSGGSSDV